MDWASSDLILDLFTKKLTCLRSNMSLVLPLDRTETDNSLTTSGGQVHEAKREGILLCLVGIGSQGYPKFEMPIRVKTAPKSILKNLKHFRIQEMQTI